MNADKSALANSIERKMDQLLKSVSSRDRSCKPERRSTSSLVPDASSPTTPNNGLSSIVPGEGCITDKIKSGLSGPSTKTEGTGHTGLTISEDDFHETFSDGSEEPEVLNGGMPVDSLANFIPPAKNDAIEGPVGDRVTEAGTITEHGAVKHTRRSGGEVSLPKKKGSMPREGKFTAMNAAGRLIKKLTGGFRGKRTSMDDDQP